MFNNGHHTIKVFNPITGNLDEFKNLADKEIVTMALENLTINNAFFVNFGNECIINSLTDNEEAILNELIILE